MKLDRIDYNGGEIWIDKKAKIKIGDTYVLIVTDGKTFLKIKSVNYV